MKPKTKLEKETKAILVNIYTERILLEYNYLFDHSVGKINEKKLIKLTAKNLKLKEEFVKEIIKKWKKELKKRK